MPLHLIKLCVGVDTVDDLQGWIDRRLGRARAENRPLETFHTTRMSPRRRDDLLDGGSLYWVIKGLVQARQKLVDIRPFTDDAGIKRCRLILDPALVATEMQPRRPFQGWRYFSDADVPGDLSARSGEAAMPAEMRRELAELGLL